ncbi:hypothetical protein LRAMOSA00574 [Lichtheimia ramosa]|uniref:NELF-A N-terminal domain-containing protein n=1 Tax=Lichtheimia ramosa TaxID=688394 RepID=A0A077W6W0_9FUNG|nr:hypothetical protein LRAMOSA00574 [Lichtheimia ramosa]
MIQTLPGNGATVSSGASNWSSAKLGHLLSTELLQDIHENFDEMGKAAKVGILFAMLYVRKGDIMRMQSVINKIYAAAENDDHEWIQVTSRILKNALTERRLNTRVEQWSPSFGDVVDKVEGAVKQDGISFHPTEYALLTKEAQPECPYASKVYRSDEPTHDQHFKLNTTAMDKSNSDRQQLFQELLKKNDANARRSMSPPTKMGRPGVMGPNGPLQSRPRPPPSSGMFRRYPNATQPPPSSMAPKPAAKSLFIPSRARKPSLGSASNFAKLPQGMPVRPPLPSPSSDTTPKGFLRQSRVQMIDFNENTTLEKNNAEELNAAKEQLQAEKEARKEMAAEKRRLDKDRKRREAEEDRQRAREEKLSNIPSGGDPKRQRRAQPTNPQINT